MTPNSQDPSASSFASDSALPSASIGAELEADGAWLRALAAALTRDPGRAEEAAQVTWLQSWRERSGGHAPSRSWLRVVLVNTLRRDLRDQARREGRQIRAARPEAMESETLERIELQQAVLDAVRALKEPYRTTIVHRFFNGDSVASIAAREGIPPKTVQTRVTRGIASLRASLERRSESDAKSSLETLAIFALPSSSSLPFAGSSLMGLGLKGVLCATVVIASIVGYSRLGGGPVDVGRAPLLADVSGASSKSELALVDMAALVDEGRITQATGTVGAPVAGELLDVSRTLWRGVVRDLRGGPIAGLTLGLWPGGSREDHRRGAPSRRVVSDSAGRFAIEVGDAAWIAAADDGWTLLFHPRVESSASEGGKELQLVAISAVDLSGRVLDDEGTPIGDCHVRSEIDLSVYLSMSSGSALETVIERTTRTDDDGRFVLARVPSLRSARIHASAAGYDTASIEVPQDNRDDLDIVLEKARAFAGSLEGRVVDAAGSPIEGAWVTTGGVVAQSGPDGEFVVRINAMPQASSTSVQAVVSGWQPVDRTVALPPSGPVELVVDAPTLFIDGAVVDADGQPVRDVYVWLGGQESFGVIDRQLSGVTYRTSVSVEELMQPEGTSWGTQVVEPGTGRFEFKGLRDAVYRVRAMDSRTLHTATIDGVSAGTTGLQIRWDEPVEERPLSGLLVDESGTPLSGIKVRVGLPQEFPLLPLPGPALTTSDADGRFLMPDVAAERVSVIIEDPDGRFDDVRMTLETLEEREALVIELKSVVTMQFEISDPRFEKGMLQVLDAAGQWMTIKSHHGKEDFRSDRTLIANGRTGPVSFPDTAKVVVVRSGDLELRMALDMSAPRDSPIIVR